MKSKDLISQIKSEITEIEIDAVNSESVTFLDVREPVEIEGGIIANSIHIPRGTLETNIENKIPNQDENIIIYCASGIRSAFAAKTLMDLGYKNVKSSMDGKIKGMTLKFQNF